MSKPIVVIACMLSSSESWEPQTAPTSLALTCRWRSRPQHHLRTHAPQQTASSFDHLISAREQRRRHVEAERLRGLEVDQQLVLGWRLHRQIGGPLALENAVDVSGGTPVRVDRRVPVGDQAAAGDEDALEVHGGKLMPGR